MMHVLEMPEAFARPRIEREQTVGEEIGAVSVGAVEIERARAGRKIRDAALGIDGDFTPGVGSPDVAPRVLWPGVVAKLAGMRNSVKLPHEFSRDDVVGAQISGR